MKSLSVWTFLLATSLAAFAAQAEPVDSRFKPTAPDPLMGDWQGTAGYVVQVFPTEGGKYQANVFKTFDEPDAKPLAILKGDITALTGDGWNGTIAGAHFKANKGGERFDLQRITRTPPTLGTPPPAGAVVLFDGKNLDAWAKKKGKDWLTEDGPAQWKILPMARSRLCPPLTASSRSGNSATAKSMSSFARSAHPATAAFISRPATK